MRSIVAKQCRADRWGRWGSSRRRVRRAHRRNRQRRGYVRSERISAGRRHRSCRLAGFENGSSKDTRDSDVTGIAGQQSSLIGTHTARGSHALGAFCLDCGFHALPPWILVRDKTGKLGMPPEPSGGGKSLSPGFEGAGENTICIRVRQRKRNRKVVAPPQFTVDKIVSFEFRGVDLTESPPNPGLPFWT